MKAGLRITVGIAAAIAIAIVGLGVVWFLWGRHLWATGTVGTVEQFAEEGETLSWEMRSGGTEWQNDATRVRTGSSPLPDEALTSDRAWKAVKVYIQRLGYADLEIVEMIEFERSFYVVVRERDSGICALEVVVDKATGEVGPEIGPNMMWNVRYGTHRRGAMATNHWSEVNALSQEQAVEIAQRWLNANRPGVRAEREATPFYGYYAIHTMRDGQIEGMLSVHGVTGQVWYRVWREGFVRVVKGGPGHD